MRHHSSWLDSEFRPPSSSWYRSGLTSRRFPSPYINIGCDEPLRQASELYVPFVQRALSFVRSLGKRAVRWQESVRAAADPEQLIQHWITLPSADSSHPSQKFSPEILKNIAIS
jgi:hypothetical protein